MLCRLAVAPSSSVGHLRHACLPFSSPPSAALLLFRGKYGTELRWPPNVIGAANPKSLAHSLRGPGGQSLVPGGNPLKSTNGKAETANENGERPGVAPALPLCAKLGSLGYLELAYRISNLACRSRKSLNKLPSDSNSRQANFK